MKTKKQLLSGCNLKQKIIGLSSLMVAFTLLLVGCNQTNDYANQQGYYQAQPNPNSGYYQYPQQFGAMQPMNNSAPKSGNNNSGTGNTQKSVPSYGGGGTGQSGYQAMGNMWNNMWGGSSDSGYYSDQGGYYGGYDSSGNYGDYGNYGYDSGNYGYGAGDYYGSGYSDDYANQTYQDIYENRAATNQEINDNTSQWLYEGEANYINPETGELESHDYTQGNDWYQDSSGDQWQTSDSSYTPEYSTETQMEEYGGWASDYSASDYGYDSGSYDSGSYDYE
ncbi:MAG: hypothetical protein ACOZAR_00580 [Patescibacteria group bacterium]